MANYSLVINSKFRPFSYSELMAPVQQSTEAHQQVEAAYGALDTQASKWENLANQQTDEKAYTMYKTYADDLRAQADNLARNGLTSMSRKDLLNMQSRYSKEIVPIETAYNRRQALADEQRKIMLTDPTRRFERDANTISLDTLIDNPAYDYGRNYSGSMLTQQVSNAVAGLARELRDYGKGKRLDAYTNTFLKKRGMTSEEVTQFIKDLHNPNSEAYNSALGKVVNSVIASSGVGSWGNRQALDEAYDFAGLGTWNAIGQSDVTPFTDQGALLAARRKTEEPGVPTPSNNNIVPHSIFTHREKDDIDKNAKKAARFKNMFKSYKDSKGKIRYELTPEGRNKIKEEIRIEAMQAIGPYGEYGEYGDEMLSNPNAKVAKDADEGNLKRSKFLRKLDLTEKQFNSMTDKEIGDYWQSRYEGTLSRPDGTEYIDYSYAIDQTVQNDAQDLMFTAAPNGLYEMDFDKEKEAYVKTKNKYDITELKDNKYVPVSITYGKYGDTVTFRSSKEGNPDLTLEMPVLNSSKKKENDQLIADIIGIEAKYGKQEYENLIDEERGKNLIQKSYNDKVEQLYDNYASMLRTNTQETFKTQ